MRTGALPTLIEWDNDIPPFNILAADVARAKVALADGAARRRSLIAA